MSTLTYAHVLLLINKHQRQGTITQDKAHQLHMMFKELYEKGTPSSLILEVLK